MKSNPLFRVTLVALLSTAAMACSGGDDSSNLDAGNDVSTIDQTAPDVAKPDATPDVTTPDADVDADADIDAGDANDGAPDLDAGNDASTLPPEGSPCTNPAEVQSEPCGFCGTHDRACLPDGKGGHVWGAWGYCQGQPNNACDPNLTYSDVPCPGKCATQHHVCLSNCTFDQTQACNEPTNACWPNNLDYEEGLSCTSGGRERTCNAQCQWGNFGACQSGPSLVTLQVPSNVGDVTSVVQTLDGNSTLQRVVTANCPSTLSTTTSAYNYVLVHNPSTQAATVDIFHSTAPGGSTIDTVMTAYLGSTAPANTDTSARQACMGYVDDSCSDTSSTNPPSCASNWAGLMVGNNHGVTIPPGGDVVVYSAAYSTGTGDFQINVRTKAFNNAYTLGGTVSGLTGSVVLKNNGIDVLSLSANGNFTFAAPLIAGATYAVTVATQPSGEICTVTNGFGTMGTSPVTNIGVVCATPSSIGGTVTGLSGTLTLQNNGGNNLVLTADGNFTFTQAAVPYNVTVLKHPTGQTCTVTNGSGTATGPVTNVAVQCAATVSGVPQTMNVPSSINTITSLIQTFSTTTTITRLITGTTCPTTLSSSSTSYNYVVIHNPNTLSATVDVFHSSAPDTEMAVYAGAVPPANTNTTARQSCQGYVDDTCSDTSNVNPPSCASTSQAGLMVSEGHGVTIPAGGDVVLYSAMWSGTSSSDFQINVKTRSLQ